MTDEIFKEGKNGLEIFKIIFQISHPKDFIFVESAKYNDRLEFLLSFSSSLAGAEMAVEVGPLFKSTEINVVEELSLGYSFLISVVVVFEFR